MDYFLAYEKNIEKSSKMEDGHKMTMNFQNEKEMN
jgi:hypothetical protein